MKSVSRFRRLASLLSERRATPFFRIKGDDSFNMGEWWDDFEPAALPNLPRVNRDWYRSPFPSALTMHNENPGFGFPRMAACFLAFHPNGFGQGFSGVLLHPSAHPGNTILDALLDPDSIQAFSPSLIQPSFPDLFLFRAHTAALAGMFTMFSAFPGG